MFFKALELGALDFVPQARPPRSRRNRGTRRDSEKGIARSVAASFVRPDVNRAAAGQRVVHDGRAARGFRFSRPPCRPLPRPQNRRRHRRFDGRAERPPAALRTPSGDVACGVRRRPAHARQVHANLCRAARQAGRGANRRGERRGSRGRGHGLRLPRAKVHGNRHAGASSSSLAWGPPARKTATYPVPTASSRASALSGPVVSASSSPEWVTTGSRARGQCATPAG